MNRGETRPPGTPGGSGGEAEILIALGIMVAVLAGLSLVSLGRPELVAACIPLLILAHAAVRPFGLRQAGGWGIAVSLGALLAQDAAWLGLLYPVAVLLPVGWARRRYGGGE